MIEIVHDPRCWLAQAQAGEDAPEICTCEQIAQLEEQARSVLEPEPAFSGLPGYGGLYGTAYVPMGTYTSVDPWASAADLSHHIDRVAKAVYDPGKIKVDELAAKRAEIYAKSDAEREWDPNPLRWLKGKGFGRK